MWWLEVQFNGILEGDREMQDVSLNPYLINVFWTTSIAIYFLFFYAIK